MDINVDTADGVDTTKLGGELDVKIAERKNRGVRLLVNLDDLGRLGTVYLLGVLVGLLYRRSCLRLSFL